jgi:hypothetical protein
MVRQAVGSATRQRGTRMKSSSRDRPDHQRLALAVEAARIIQEEGLLDFRSAKAKAAERLGLGRRAHLPDNAEIEAALAERNRIFHGEKLPELLVTLRQAAFELMRDLGSYQPRLVGDVLSGNATVHTSVDLHLFSDTPEAVGASLESLGVGYRSIVRRHRLRHDEVEQFPGYRFAVHECEFTSTVFPVRLRGHAPLSPVDGRPMRRAGLRELAGLLGFAAETPQPTSA